MTSRPWRAVALLGPTVALLLFAGCAGDDTDADADLAVSPATTACRTYLLAVGDSDTAAADRVGRAVGSVGYSPDAIDALLTATADAARAAGLVEGLPEADFERYLAVTSASHQAAATLAGGDDLRIAASSLEIEAAVDDVREACGVAQDE